MFLVVLVYIFVKKELGLDSYVLYISLGKLDMVIFSVGIFGFFYFLVELSIFFRILKRLFNEEGFGS